MSPVHHVLGEHVGDDGLLHGQHLSDDDVAASDGEAPPAVFVLEGDGVAHHGVEGVLVGHVWQLGPAGGEGGGWRNGQGRCSNLLKMDVHGLIPPHTLWCIFEEV